MSATDPVLELIRRWAAAEEANDSGRIDGLLAQDFVAVGPLGFVLDRAQWLERFRNGLENRAFAVEDPRVHRHGDAAVVIAIAASETSWRGSDNSGRFRHTIVAVRSGDQWRLAAVHIGPLQPAPTQG